MKYGEASGTREADYHGLATFWRARERRKHQKSRVCGGVYRLALCITRPRERSHQSDWKKNYSFSIQIENMPNGVIVDYTFGHVGSINNAILYKATKLFDDQTDGSAEGLLAPGGWCRDDSGYPMPSWHITPYPQTDTFVRWPRNLRIPNLTLSRVRNSKEHASLFFVVTIVLEADNRHRYPVIVVSFLSCWLKLSVQQLSKTSVLTIFYKLDACHLWLPTDFLGTTKSTSNTDSHFVPGTSHILLLSMTC